MLAQKGTHWPWYNLHLEIQRSIQAAILIFQAQDRSMKSSFLVLVWKYNGLSHALGREMPKAQTLDMKGWKNVQNSASGSSVAPYWAHTDFQI